jgi:hypothetical protein
VKVPVWRLALIWGYLSGCRRDNDRLAGKIDVSGPAEFAGDLARTSSPLRGVKELELRLGAGTRIFGLYWAWDNLAASHSVGFATLPQ